MTRYAAIIERWPMHAVFEARGRPAALESGMAAAGFALPDGRNRFAPAGADGMVLRVGPARAMLIAPLTAEARIEAALQDAFAAAPAANFANISDMLAGFEVRGAGAIDILKQGSALDLTPSAFAAGAATWTEIWAIGALLIRWRSDDYLLLADRSFAGYLEDWLGIANGEASRLRPATMISPPASYRPS
jgi:heterotetrameric sarcosine oxidase gamma subunit